MSCQSAQIPEFDPQLDPKIVDIFNPSDLWESRKSETAQATVTSTGPTASIAASHISTKSATGTTAAAAGNNNLYCAVCRKKFNNEATWQNHLKSAKHLANVKAKSKQQQPVSSKKTTTRSADPPGLQDALKNFQRASMNPAGAVPNLWSLSKTFYSLCRPRNTYQSLSMVIDILQQQNHKQDPGPIHGLTPSQISSTLYVARLSQARLECIYNPTSLENAQNLILDALNDKWKIDRQELCELVNTCICSPIEMTLTQCRHLATRFIDREESRTAPAKPKTDQNQCFTKVLLEAANIFRNKTHFRIVLLCLTVVICKYEGFSEYQPLKDIAETFDSMNLQHLSSAAHVLCSASVSREDTKMVQWHLFLALLLAMETDDIVRVNHIQRIVEREKQEYTLLEDMQVLLTICAAREAYDHLTLEHRVIQQISHVALLLEVTKTDLLLRLEADEMRRSKLISRMQSLALVNSFD